MQCTSLYTFWKGNETKNPYLASNCTKNSKQILIDICWTIDQKVSQIGFVQICLRKNIFFDTFWSIILKISIFNKNVYNDVLRITGSKVTALNVFYHSTFAVPLIQNYEIVYDRVSRKH